MKIRKEFLSNERLGSLLNNLAILGMIASIILVIIRLVHLHDWNLEPPVDVIVGSCVVSLLATSLIFLFQRQR